MNETVELIRRYWGGKRLVDLHDQALSQETGVAFDALKTADGQRLVLVVCVTGAAAEFLSERVGNQPSEDWESVGLFELAKRSSVDGCIAATKAASSSALAFSASDPDSMIKLESLFKGSLG